MFPTPLAILMFLAPESPWWLVRKGRLEEAAKSVARLGRKTRLNTSEAVAMMRRTVDLEKTVKEPNLAELFKGTDLYRTLIVCGVYAAQNLTGNLIANQAVYFFERKFYISNPGAILAPGRDEYVCADTQAQRPACRPTPPSPWASSPRPCR